MESTESLASAVRDYRDLTHETANKAADALWLLGLIERHNWKLLPDEDGSGVPWEVESLTCNHDGSTLIQALTEASRCPRCTGGET